MKRALIIVDVQNDFLPGGSLSVPKSDEILPFINQLLEMPFDMRVASMDWHPLGHCSFASTWGKKHGERILTEGEEQILWPDHCVQGTKGAQLHKSLQSKSFDFIAHKGSDKNVDSYSTFFDNRKLKSTGLDKFLKEQQIDELYFAGLTTEYCVYCSAMDALDLQFRVGVVIDACRGIDLVFGDVEKACSKMKEKGVEFLTTEEMSKRFGE